MENSSFCDSSDSLKRLMKQTQENEKLKKNLTKTRFTQIESHAAKGHSYVNMED